MIAAARGWTDSITGSAPRLVDPVLIAYGIHQALTLRLPLQFHVGFGDRDLALARVNPLLLTDFLAGPEAAHSPILLLHCYPYEREAGYLAQAFAQVHLDVGLAGHFLGARATALVARSLELAPFHKVLYSSDACGARPSSTTSVPGSGGWPSAGRSAVGWRQATGPSPRPAGSSPMIAAGNARRVYGLD